MGQEDFALWLRAELDAQGWRQSDLAKATGLHSGTNGLLYIYCFHLTVTEVRYGEFTVEVP